MTDPLWRLTAGEIARRVAARQHSAEEVTRAHLDRLAEVEPRVDAFLQVLADRALGKARDLDAALASGRPAPPLAGVPLAVKDVLDIEGLPTTCGSRILEGYRPPFTATAVARLEAAGAIVVGKTNMDEFAMGSSTENSAYKKTKNPWDPTRVPGGSSGGSAAAVAAGMACLALGTDTVGPFARSVEDVALVASLLCGPDPCDATSADRPVPDFVQGLAAGAEGLRVGVPWSFLEQGVEAGVLSSFREALRVLEGVGARVVEVSLPHLPHAIATYYIVATAEASSNLARYDGVRYGLRAPAPDLGKMYGESRDHGFGPEVKRRIILGTFVLSSGYYDAYYLRAQRVRTLIRQDFERALENCDVVATPTTPSPAFRFGEKTEDPLQMYLADIFTVPANLAGVPGLSLPCGRAADLPVGLQLLGRGFDEATLLRAGHAYQGASPHHRQAPPL